MITQQLAVATMALWLTTVIVVSAITAIRPRGFSLTARQVRIVSLWSVGGAFGEMFTLALAGFWGW